MCATDAASHFLGGAMVGSPYSQYESGPRARGSRVGRTTQQTGRVTGPSLQVARRAAVAVLAAGVIRFGPGPHVRLQHPLRHGRFRVPRPRRMKSALTSVGIVVPPVDAVLTRSLWLALLRHGSLPHMPQERPPIPLLL